MKKQIKSFFLKPSNRIGLGVLVTLGFIAGAIAWLLPFANFEKRNR